MEKASVAKSRGAVWNGVSNTPSTGANKMSQKMRANCERVKLVLAWAVDAVSAREVGTHNHGQDAVFGVKAARYRVSHATR